LTVALKHQKSKSNQRISYMYMHYNLSIMHALNLYYTCLRPWASNW
jgi:hypothetical protein